jgi:protein SCO1/2
MKNLHFRGLLITLVALSISLAACHHKSETQARYYQLKGTVISVDKTHQQIIVSHEAIPGFMSAMTMPYTVKEGAVLDELNAGDQITARVVVMPGDVWLDKILVVKSGVSPQAAIEHHIPQPGEKVPDFSFINQYGRKVHFRRYHGKTVLLTFIYTRCPFANYCPRMTSNFAEINKALEANKVLAARTHLLTLSFDPKHDTPKVLRAYAAGYTGKDDPGFRHWEFGSVPSRELKAVSGFFGLSYWVQGGQLFHSMSTALVGADGELFRWYPGNSWSPARVLNDIKTLEARNPKSREEALK